MANAAPKESSGRTTDTKEDPMYGRNPSFAWKRLEEKDQRTCNQLTQQLQSAQPLQGEEEASPPVRDEEDELIPVPVKEDEILTEDTDLLLQGARIDVTPTEGVTTQWPEELRAATQRLSEASTSVVPQEIDWSAVVNREEAFCTSTGKTQKSCAMHTLAEYGAQWITALKALTRCMNRKVVYTQRGNRSNS